MEPVCQKVTFWAGRMHMRSEGCVMVSNRLLLEMMLEDGVEPCMAVTVLQRE